eukprot:7808767-Lingulodinium_polyedra.AAC.1
MGIPSRRGSSSSPASARRSCAGFWHRLPAPQPRARRGAMLGDLRFGSGPSPVWQRPRASSAGPYVRLDARNSWSLVGSTLSGLGAFTSRQLERRPALGASRPSTRRKPELLADSSGPRRPRRPKEKAGPVSAQAKERRAARRLSRAAPQGSQQAGRLTFAEACSVGPRTRQAYEAA